MTAKKDISRIRLYHGSKNGLVGPIRPLSRDCCDFGSGFYMGDAPRQPLTLICRQENPWFYELELDLSGLALGRFENLRQWALYIAYNRGAMRNYADTPLSARMKALFAERDVIAGPIANDRVFYAAQRFFDGLITLETLTEVLKALTLGNQYVALTNKACCQIRILERRQLTKEECEALLQESQKQRRQSENRTAEIIRSRRHQDGFFFDEICERIAAGEEDL